jgi:hypothetical protein
MATRPTINDIKDTLSECYESRKHVLLHGKDSKNSIDMVLDVHASNGGNVDVVQFIANEKYSKEKVFETRVGRVLVKANERYGMSEIELSDCPEAKEEVKKYRRIRDKVDKEVRDRYKSTESNWKRLDCKGESILSVYNRLVDGEHWQDIEIPPLDDGDRDNLYSLARVEISGSYLSDFKGTLFVDNLQCDTAKDIEYFFKLAEAIKKSSLRWLVISTRSLDKLSKVKVLRGLFKPLSLSKETTYDEMQADTGVEAVNSVKVTGTDEKDLTSKSLSMDAENNVLYFDKNNLVTLNPEEIRLIEYLREHDAFELEQILTEHFNITLTEPYKHSKNITAALSLNTTKPTIEEKNKAISKGDRNRFDRYKSSINKKCQPLVRGDLIVKHGAIKKAFKLTVKIKKGTLQL